VPVSLDGECPKTGTLERTRDGTTMGGSVAFPGFIIVAAPWAGAPARAPGWCSQVRRDRQAGREPPREWPAAQLHGEYPGPVRPRPRQDARLEMVEAEGHWSEKPCRRRRFDGSDSDSRVPALRQAANRIGHGPINRY